MRHIKLDTDIQPLSAFRSRTAHFIKQINEDRRPLVLTQHGKSIAVVINVIDYENLIEKRELLDDIRLAEEQIEQGLGATHENVVKFVRAKY
jgi:prevent-host-death family protein